MLTINMVFICRKIVNYSVSLLSNWHLNSTSYKVHVACSWNNRAKVGCRLVSLTVLMTSLSLLTGTRWQSGTVPDLRSRGRGSNPALGCCVPTPTQRAIPQGLVNEYQQKLGSKRAYHAMHWPRIRGLAASAGVRLRAKETEISAAPWALRLGEKGLYFTICWYELLN